MDAASANVYFEVTIGGTDTNQLVGLANSSITLTGYVGQGANGYGVYRLNGNFFNSGSSIGGSALYIYAAGDVLGFWLDAGTLKVAKNSALLASFNTIATGLTGTWYPAYSTAGTGPPPSSSGTLNTGGSAFSYQPTGSNAWG